MKRGNWLDGCELADPDTAVVSHVVGFWRDMFSRVTGTVPRPLCGASLIADDDSADPTPDSPVCARCALGAWQPSRIANALRGLWRGPALLATLILLSASSAGLLVAVWLHTELAWIPVGTLDAALVLLYLAPDDDENGGES